MLPFYRLILFGLAILFALTACGGGGGGNSESATEASTNCVIGTSKIGECKL